jgi:hypothetical protein
MDKIELDCLRHIEILVERGYLDPARRQEFYNKLLKLKRGDSDMTHEDSADDVDV